MADRTITIICDTGHFVEIKIPKVLIDHATEPDQANALAIVIGVEAIRLLALPDPTSTVELSTE